MIMLLYFYFRVISVNMSSESEDEIPELVEKNDKRVPITIITGFLGKSRYVVYLICF